MRYSLEPTYSRNVKGYGFLSFARKFEYCNKTGINAAKKFGDKYGENLMDTAKKETIFAKTVGKRIV